jgi:hypothetical protein
MGGASTVPTRRSDPANTPAVTRLVSSSSSGLEPGSNSSSNCDRTAHQRPHGAPARRLPLTPGDAGVCRRLRRARVPRPLRAPCGRRYRRSHPGSSRRVGCHSGCLRRFRCASCDAWFARAQARVGGVAAHSGGHHRCLVRWPGGRGVRTRPRRRGLRGGLVKTGGAGCGQTAPMALLTDPVYPTSGPRQRNVSETSATSDLVRA